MANVVVTGGAGFLGSRLARELLAGRTLAVAGGPARPVARLTLIDQASFPDDLVADTRVTVVRGDLADLLDPANGGPAHLAGADVIFHLAAAVSAECEADFDLGMRANLAATERLLASCRSLGTSPVVVFSSSVAAFGTSEDHPLPRVVDDQTMPNPQSSYGIQKVIGEHLIADYTRKGFVRGRTVRLMTVVVRPGRPNAAASGFLSSIIREPLRGESSDLSCRSADRGGPGLTCQGDRGTLARRDIIGPGLGRPDRGQPARAHGDGAGHGRRARPRSGPRGRRLDRMDARSRDRADRDELASRRKGRPRGPARPGCRR